MDQEASVSGNDVNVNEIVVESDEDGCLERVPSDVVIEELQNVREVMMGVELELACVSEKLLNLSGFMMHVETKESDFEAFISKEEETLVDSEEKTLEFTLLSEILDSEVSELDKLMAVLQMEIKGAQELLSSYTYLGETFTVMEGKLQDSTESLKQLQDQVSEIRMQSLKLKRTFSGSNEEMNYNSQVSDYGILGKALAGNIDKGANHLEEDIFSKKNVLSNMQTEKQQRHILRTLEKSLAREMDLEKKLTESKQIEEDLKLRLLSAERETYLMEDEAADVWQRWLEADLASGVVTGISKELLGRLQILQLNLNGSVKREAELQLKVDDLLEDKQISLQKLDSSNAKVNDFLQAQTDSLKDNLKKAEDKLILCDSEAFTLNEKVSSLEDEISEMGKVIIDLKENESKAEVRAQNADAKCELLTVTNTKLNEELGLLLTQLEESRMHLHQAVAIADASEEKQSMLNSTIRDMENLIKDLKQKVSESESRADSVEDRCITISESNEALRNEISILKGKLKRSEAALHQAGEAKIATANDIAHRSKVITNLIVQLAFERERLHKQMSSLAMQNKTLIMKLQMNDNPSMAMHSDEGGNVKEFIHSEQDLAARTKESREEAHEFSANNSQLDRTQKSVSVGEREVGSADTVRRVDAGVLNFKHVLMAMLIVLTTCAAYFLIQQDTRF